MRRYGNLWPSLTAYENLENAAKKAAKGKRGRADVREYWFHLENELWRLHDRLERGDYWPAPYRSFMIEDPKPRLISAAPFRDRVVHHAVCNVIGPIWEKTMIYHSYASRAGKGTHAAIRQCQQYLRQSRYVLKGDYRKYFPSIDLEILKRKIATKIKDKRVLELIGRIIDGSNPQEDVSFLFPDDEPGLRRGLPLGNQTSQLFANIFLDEIDHMVVDRWRFSRYIRYMDDFVVFSDNRESLVVLLDWIREAANLQGLKLHPNKCHIMPCDQSQGLRFLGQRIFRDFRLLPKENVRQFRRRLAGMVRDREAGVLSEKNMNQRVQSWIGHASQADTYRLREQLLKPVGFFGSNT